VVRAIGWRHDLLFQACQPAGRDVSESCGSGVTGDLQGAF